MHVPLLLFALLGGLLFFAQCKSDSPSQAGSSSSQAVDEVLSISGEASATGAALGEHSLEVGSAIYGDDRIQIAANASVDIQLQHNSAIWNVLGAKDELVRKSLAWSRKGKSTGLFGKEGEQRTSSAGRHSERQAAEDHCETQHDGKATRRPRGASPRRRASAL
ncbi:MAG: hypothetical protein GY811_21750 [Myxococcales bacterium]|nr:hypothetical protein [Myxococcales bacterium]